MASFVTILKRVATVLVGFERVAPIAEGLFPVYAPEIAMLDGIFGWLQTIIMTQEQNNPASQQGPAKSAGAQQSFADSIAVIQDVLAGQGKLMTYDGGALQKAIDAQVAAYNAMASVKASFKIVDK